LVILGRTKLETETAIAGVADAVVYPVSADFSGAAFWALPCGCCLEPLLVSVGDFGERFLVVVEECFDDIFHCIYFFYLLVWFVGGLPSMDSTIGNLLGFATIIFKNIFVILQKSIDTRRCR